MGCVPTVISGVGVFRAVSASDPDAFFKRHCHECHADGEKAGGLDLGRLSVEMSTRQQIEYWTRIYDRVAQGEMPPDAKTGPTANERKNFLAGLEPRLATMKHLFRHNSIRSFNVKPSRSSSVVGGAFRLLVPSKL